jgi:hypothetical protein
VRPTPREIDGLVLSCFSENFLAIALGATHTKSPRRDFYSMEAAPLLARPSHPGPVLDHSLEFFKSFNAEEKSLEDLDVKSKHSSERSSRTSDVFVFLFVFFTMYFYLVMNFYCLSLNMSG